MKAYLIDPFARAITEVEYNGDYNEIYDLIDCDVFACVDIDCKGNTVFIDDEGLITGKEQEFFNITHDEQGASQPLAGKGLVLGTDKEGESVAPSLTIEELRKRVKFIPLPLLQQFIHEGM